MFYYKTSEKGKRLADILQKRFDFVLGENNRRQAKPNDTYYLLLHVKSPIVIVECGFLSNWDEAARLNSTDYQDRLAWTLHMGILRYLNTRNCSVPSQFTSKNPLKIAFGNRIFACKPMFSYGPRSECADLLNSYEYTITPHKNFMELFRIHKKPTHLTLENTL